MAKNWDLYKSEITKLYITNGRPLDDVQRILKGRHNFDASIRAYRMKLEEWGIRKNRVPARLRNRGRSQRVSTIIAANHTSSPPTVPHQRSETNASAVNLPSVSTLQTPAVDPWAMTFNLTGSHGDNPFAAGMNEHRENPYGMAVQYIDQIPENNLASSEGLFTAISNGDEQEVENLLSSGASVTTRDQTNNCALHNAIKKGKIAIVKSLLKYGADVNAAGFKMKTPLHLAIDSQPILTLLLRYHPTLSLQDDRGNTALHDLLERTDWSKPTNITKEMIKMILSAGVDINIKNNLGVSPLHQIVVDASCSLDHMDIISDFLDLQPDVISPMRNGKSLLAVFLHESKLLSHGDNYHNYYGIILNVTKRFRCLEQFLIAGADPNTKLHLKPMLTECLEHAAFPENTEASKVVVRLIETSNIDVTGSKGNHPLHLLLNRYNSKGPRHWDFAHSSVVSALISRGADPNQTNDAGATPLEIWLQYSYRHKSTDVVKVALLLVQAGADTMKTTSTGTSIIDKANTPEKGDCARLIKAFLKADIDSQRKEDEASPNLEWVSVWRSAWKQPLWQHAKDCLSELQYTPSRPRNTDFMECASLVVIEHLLEKRQSRLKLWLNGELDKDSVVEDHEEYCAILKDCRARKADVDISWYTFLLDLMDFKSS